MHAITEGFFFLCELIGTFFSNTKEKIVSITRFQLFVL